MGRDHFVYWNDEKPTKDDIERVIVQFFGPDILKKLTHSGKRFYVTLAGRWTNAVVGVRPVMEGHKKPFGAFTHGDGAPTPEELDDAYTRCLEVFVHEDSIDIITRHADDFTNACARGLAYTFKCWWNGRTEEE
jgi:hypothetical protein